MIKIRLLLQGGHIYETTCSEDAPLLEALSDALSNAGSTSVPGFEQLIVETGGALRGLALPYSAIVAVETDPPFTLPSRPTSITVERAPYIRIPGFLTEAENRAVLNYAISKQPDFVASGVDNGARDYRESRVLFRLDDLYVDLEERIREILSEALEYFRLPKPADTTFETQLSAHNDGGYFKIHNDNGTPGTANRVLTYVYYFQRQPKAFNGGKLRLYDSKVEARTYVAASTFTEIEPENNMLVMFPSRLLHEVLPTYCSAFADGRFTLNGWVRDTSKQS